MIRHVKAKSLNLPIEYTALMLHMNSSRRLSIDIDIIMQEQTNLQPAFDAIGIDKGFTGVEEQERAAGYAVQ